MEMNKECFICTEQFHRCRSSVSRCAQCDYSLCSECLIIHRRKHQPEISRLEDQYSELINQIREKSKYVDNTSNDSIEVVVNWYQRLINDLIESQTQMIGDIQNERDRARNELAQYDLNVQAIHKDITQQNENMKIDLIQDKLNDLSKKLSNYQVTADVYLPNSSVFQPRYKVSYQFKDSSSVEEDWDNETNEVTNRSLPPNQQTTTMPLFSSDTSQTFVTPKDEDADEWEHFLWHEELEGSHHTDSEYFLDPRLYHPGTSRHFNADIHLIASNGTDLLCYSRQTKQLIFVGNGDINPLTLQWYHGHLLQLVWSDHLKSFVTITDHNRYEIYSIECTHNLRLKIRLRTCLPPPANDIIKDQLFLRTDECHLFLYYERTDGRKRLRLLNSAYECVQSYPIDQCLQRDEHIHAHDDGLVIGLGVNQEHVVLFIRSAVDDDRAGQVEDTRLLVFRKTKMCFIRRVILPNHHFQLPFVVYFLNLSSFVLLDQMHHILRFYNYDKEIGQINLLPSNTSPIFNSTTVSESNLHCQYPSIVLMNDGSLLLSNDTRNLLRFILHDHSDDFEEW